MAKPDKTKAQDDEIAEAEVIPSTDVEVIEGDPYESLTESAKVATLHQRDETIRRLRVGQEVMEENRDHWMGRAERAEAAIRTVVHAGQGCLEDLQAQRG